MANITIEKAAETVRRLLTVYAVDKETRELIATLDDEAILDYAEETLSQAEAKNNAFIEELEGAQ